MIRAVLLDLDDTLLGNPTEAFVSAYMDALNRYLCERLGVEDTLQPVLAATRAVMLSRDPLRTNEETFYAALAPLLPGHMDAFREGAAAFYEAVYPALRGGTHVRTGARALVEGLAARGYRVVVATNPFFPRVAVKQRLDWAGLPVGEMPFALVTTLENAHFSKPHPDYYEEILARIEVAPGEAIMVGDDWNNDIVPAHRAGLHTYWIAPRDAAPGPEASPVGVGPLEDFAACVARVGWSDNLAPRPLEPAHIAPRLNGGLAALLGIAREIAPDAWTIRPAPGEWSPAEIVCHLAETERAVHRPRLVEIAQGNEPFLAASVPGTGDCSGDGWAAALAFARERQITLDFLAGLADGAWSRPAVHHRLGATTLLGMAEHIVQHDRVHIRQLREALGDKPPA